MYKIVTTIIAACAILTASTAMAQTDAANLDNARSALDTKRNCDDAVHCLNLVSPDSRQTADYLLCMARAQDCKNNREQAIYYYNKYLQAKPGTDSVMKRVAELKDDSNNKIKLSNDEHTANDTYHKVARSKKRRRLNLDDNYYSSGVGYAMALGGDKSPYKGALTFNASDGIMLMHNKAVLDINFTSGILLSPNNVWYADATQSYYPAGTSSGFIELFTVGFAPVLVNTKHVSLTAGALAGVNFYFMSGLADGYGDNTIQNKITFCYGLKSNLYLGDNVMLFAHLLLSTANTANIRSGVTDLTVPANYGMFNMGISYKFDSWW